MTDIKIRERRRDNERRKYWTVGKVYTREIQGIRKKVKFEEVSKKLRRLKKDRQ